jgi:hypothetical protein
MKENVDGSRVFGNAHCFQKCHAHLDLRDEYFC